MSDPSRREFIKYAALAIPAVGEVLATRARIGVIGHLEPAWTQRLADGATVTRAADAPAALSSSIGDWIVVGDGHCAGALLDRGRSVCLLPPVGLAEVAALQSSHGAELHVALGRHRPRMVASARRAMDAGRIGTPLACAVSIDGPGACHDLADALDIMLDDGDLLRLGSAALAGTIPTPVRTAVGLTFDLPGVGALGVTRGRPAIEVIGDAGRLVVDDRPRVVTECDEVELQPRVVRADRVWPMLRAGRWSVGRRLHLPVVALALAEALDRSA